MFFSPAAEETALDDFDDERCCFFLTHLRIKPASDKKKIIIKKNYYLKLHYLTFWPHGGSRQRCKH